MKLDRETLGEIRDAALEMAEGFAGSREGEARLRAHRYESLARAADDLLLDLSRHEPAIVPALHAEPVPPAPASDIDADMAELRQLGAANAPARERSGSGEEETHHLIAADEAAFRRQHPRSG